MGELEKVLFYTARVRQNAVMHIVIPFAQSASPACQAALPQLRLPHLQKWLRQLKPQEQQPQERVVHAHAAYTLSCPHERVVAELQGWPWQDGLNGRAQAQAMAMGLPQAEQGHWARLTPMHWQVGIEHVHMSDPDSWALSEEESQALLATIAPYTDEDGIQLYYCGSNDWLACGDLFKDLPSASLHRVIGRNIDPWMPEGPQAAPLRRLQNEMQMLLYTHPINSAREDRGLKPLNSFWVSDTGPALPIDPAAVQPGQVPVPVKVLSPLTLPALRDDAPAWVEAWQALDQGFFKDLSAQDLHSLSLCGERCAQTWQNSPTRTPPGHWLGNLLRASWPWRRQDGLALEALRSL
jgi:hypothetical protein